MRFSSYDVERIAHADRFADRAHAGQYRKWTNEEYIEHPRRVSKILEYALVSPPVALAPSQVTSVKIAALLHDVWEDTDTTMEEIREEFGDVVAELVTQVSDVSKPEDGNRAYRKGLDRQHLARASYLGQTLKLADIIDNTRDIVKHDRKFAAVYLFEMVDLLRDLTLGDDRLWAVAKAQVAEGLQELL